MKKQILRRTFSFMALFGFLSISVFANQPVNVNKEDANDEIRLNIGDSPILFGGTGGTQEVKISKGKNYQLFCLSDWMTCREGKGGILQITAKPYDFFFPRQASIILTSKKTNYSKVIMVTQKDNQSRPDVIARPEGPNLLFLTAMDLSKSKPFYINEIRKNISVDDFPISMKGSRYEDGIATHAPTALIFRINGATHFRADVGIDDEIIRRNVPETYGHVNYEVFLDEKMVKSGNINTFDKEILKLDLNLMGGKYLIIRFTAGATTDGDHIDLGNGCFEYSGEKPVVVTEEEMKAATIEKSSTSADSSYQQESATKSKSVGCGLSCKSQKNKKGLKAGKNFRNSQKK